MIGAMTQRKRFFSTDVFPDPPPLTVNGDLEKKEEKKRTQKLKQVLMGTHLATVGQPDR